MRQLRFARHYLETGNGAEAARRAGDRGNRHVLKTIARKNLKRGLPTVEDAKNVEIISS